MRLLLLTAFAAGAYGFEPLTTAEGYELTGFAKDGVNSIASSDSGGDRPSGATFDSWGGGVDANVGTLLSPQFQAPSSLSLLLAGSPRNQGIRLYLEDTVTHQRFDLRSRLNPRFRWRRFTWEIPEEWRNRSVRLGAEDKSGDSLGWIGLSIPEKGEPSRWRSFLGSMIQATRWNIWILISTLLFLLPGLAAALWMNGKLGLDPARLACFALIASAGAGYAFFWIYFANPVAGKYLSLALPPVCGALICFRRGAGGQLREMAAAAAISCLVAMFYRNADSVYVYDENDAAESAQSRYLPGTLPPDNILPVMFAERVYESRPLRPYLFADWKSSDRPPLQAGLTLAQFPFWPAARDSHYQIAGVVFQSFWAGAVWLFLAAAGIPRRARILVLALTIPTQFFTLFSTFVWPKLLPAWLTLLAFCFTPLIGEKRPWTPLHGGIAAAAIALAMMAHPGVAFVLTGAAAALALNRSLPPPRVLVAGAAAGFAIMAPWQLYQKLYDPPGDRLLKWHLAGVPDIDSRSVSAALADSYGKLTPALFLANKWENVKALFVFPASGSLLTSAVAGSFFCLFQALGLLNFGFLAWLKRPMLPSAESRLLRNLFVIALVSILFWVLVMFEPRSTTVHQGSLATTLVLFLFCSLSLVLAAPDYAGLVAALQAAAYPIFLAAKPVLFDHTATSAVAGSADTGSMFFFLASAATMAWLWRRDQRAL